ncbi:flavin reductase family protein [Aeromicrobium alkaliterrae]|uniref:Flavin reductase family protein n=1 Tax=Aeromicrobium alkaliterrae TaxID=302168 RepID=A0ABP4W932_9ACTN
MTATAPTPAPATSDAGLRTAFRGAMANVASPVAVVTALDDGVPHGTTVSAFCSLSMEPPMLLVSLDVGSSLLRHAAVGRTLGVNVLSAAHDQLALRFAQRGVDRFGDLDWFVLDGAPALADVHAWVAVEVERLVPAGDHVVVLGRVMSAAAGTHRPLTYWQRSFGSHSTF